MEEGKGGQKTSAWRRVAEAIERLVPESAVFGDAARRVPVAPGPVVAAAPRAVAAGKAGTRRDRPSEGQRYGVRLHAMLEARASATDVLATRPADSTDEVGAAIERQAQAILASAELQDFFDPGRYLRAFNEIEILLADGSTGRIDRLVERADGWWILDYKSGSPGTAPLDDYRIRVDQYREAVAQMFPNRPVRAVLVFPDVHRIDL